jgi:ribosomal protein L24
MKESISSIKMGNTVIITRGSLKGKKAIVSGWMPNIGTYYLDIVINGKHKTATVNNGDIKLAEGKQMKKINEATVELYSPDPKSKYLTKALKKHKVKMKVTGTEKGPGGMNDMSIVKLTGASDSLKKVIDDQWPDDPDLYNDIKEVKKMKITKPQLQEAINKYVAKVITTESIDKDIMGLDEEEQRAIMGQYMAIQKGGQYNMLDFFAVQRAAFENKYYEFVNFTSNNSRAYSTIIKNYGKLKKLVKSSDVPRYKKVVTSYST